MWIQIGVVAGAIILFSLFAYFMRKSIKTYENNKNSKKKNRFRLKL